ncbi:hypothetical protein NliqN6_2786 [Naganishia liquefaciens]|uniref:Holocytochrome c-type synthase n=1 Tax=Naganishia liquefaciens TaxID=104408 RepID=A0A8H3TST2_9TREE|nr:hypothetical protein NliqN6_2786 [Naganishia liquefaciens]
MWPFSSSGQPAPATAPPAADKCPVDHSTRAAWLQANQGASPFHPPSDATSAPASTSTASIQTFVKTAANTTQDSSATTSSSPPPPPPQDPSYLSSLLSRLSNKRQVSSIPRYESTSTPTFSPNGEQTVTSSTASSSVPAPAHAAQSPAAAAAAAADDDDSDETHWVYPSEQQFFLAMMRKHAAKMYNADMPPPKPEDMKTIVPIHNAVNERAWSELMKWEQGQGGEKCGGVRLVSFKGRPRDRTPKAWLNVALGYTAPFDRHDWVINRCGQEIRYVIDFYSGRAPQAGAAAGSNPAGLPPKDAGNLSFYLDVRPAVDSWEGVRLRASKLFGQ